MKNYYFPIILLFSMISGGLTGHFLGNNATQLKFLGDIFLNLIFVAIVPLIFFSISSAVARMKSESGMFWKVMFYMLATFLLTSMVAAIFMIVVVSIFPPAQQLMISLPSLPHMEKISLSDQMISIFTVSDFSKLLSHQNMLPLILFSILTGFATAASGEKGKVFSAFLQSGSDVMLKLISIIMYLAPIGFFGFFAVLVGELGKTILDNYVRATVIYYSAATVYFFIAFSFFAYLSGKKGLSRFWKNISIPSLTALATCSSAASIPANLQAAKKMGVSETIYETVIPVGSLLHKDGSVLGAIVKIAFLFGVFHLSFTSAGVLLTALAIAVLVGSVMGAIPSGGMLGEMLILSFYGFPPETLMLIAAISIIIDPIATMLNVTGNTVCCLLIARLAEDKSTVAEIQPLHLA
jgi:Na+/H+-dicarboxylate symporter